MRDGRRRGDVLVREPAFGHVPDPASEIAGRLDSESGRDERATRDVHPVGRQRAGYGGASDRGRFGILFIEPARGHATGARRSSTCSAICSPCSGVPPSSARAPDRPAIICLHFAAICWQCSRILSPMRRFTTGPSPIAAPTAATPKIAFFITASLLLLLPLSAARPCGRRSAHQPRRG